MVTGGSGYVGSWVVKYLLEAGHEVHLTVRDKSRTDKYEIFNNIHSGMLKVFEADLLVQGSYDEAIEGCEVVMHIASPFSLRTKDHQKELIDPALKGTVNVLGSVNRTPSVKKVVLTSSVAAIIGDSIDMSEKGESHFDESHWNTTSSLKHQPYAYSKTLAEKKAWKTSEAQNNWKLVVINPAFVIGPVLSINSDSESLEFMRNMLSGKFKTGAAELNFGYVDVRDVAKAHLEAMENPNAKGRHILCNEILDVLSLSAEIEKLYPKKYKLPTFNTPKFLMYLVGPLFGLSAKYVNRNVGHLFHLKNDKSKKSLGINYTSTPDSLTGMITSMEKRNLINN